MNTDQEWTILKEEVPYWKTNVGTVPAHVKNKRRAKARVAKKSRKRNRGKK